MSGNEVVAGGLDEFLKEVVYPTLQDHINLSMIERQVFGAIEKQSIDGKFYTIRALQRGNFRYEGRFEDTDLPGTSTSVTNANDTIQDIDGLELKANRKMVYSTIKVSGPAKIAGRGAGGFKEIGALVLEQTMKMLPDQISRIYATGQVAPLGQVSSVSTTTVNFLKADAPSTLAVAPPWAGNRNVRQGMVVDFVARASAGVANVRGALRNDTTKNERGRKINSKTLDNTTPSVVLDATLDTSAVVDGDLVVPFQSRAAAAITDNAAADAAYATPMGILDAIQNANDPHYAFAYYLQAQRSAYTSLNSEMIGCGNGIAGGSSTAAMTLDKLNQLSERIELRDDGGDKPDTGYTHTSVYRKYIESQNLTVITGSSAARINDPGAGSTPTVGVKGVTIQNIGRDGALQVYVSPKAPMYRFYMMKKESLLQLEDRPIGTLNVDGLSWRQIPNRDAWTMYIGHYTSGIVNKKPSSCGYLIGALGDQNN